MKQNTITTTESAPCKTVQKGEKEPFFSPRRRRALQGWLTGFLFALPVILGIAIFSYYPAIQTFIWSFSDFSGTQITEWGFFQYEYMFTIDPDIWRIFGNTLLYAFVSVPLGLVLGYFLALTANFKIKGIAVYRLFFYMPVIIPGIVSGILFCTILGGNADGVINQLLHALGMNPEHNLTFFLSGKTAMVTLLFMGVWTAGGSMIIWLSAFKNIPETLYEAARLDGANAWQCLVKITLPMSTPMIFYNLITGVIGALQCTTPLVIDATGITGDPGSGFDNALYFVAIKIYNEAFGGGQYYGYASAIAWVLFAFIGLLTIVIFKTSKWVFYGEED